MINNRPNYNLSSLFNNLVIRPAVILIATATAVTPTLRIFAQEEDDLDIINDQTEQISQTPEEAMDAIGATSQEQLAALQKQIADIKQNKQNLNNSLQTEKNKLGQYSNEIKITTNERDLLQADIDEKELTIQELNLQIDILNKSISENETKVTNSKVEIEKLETEADQRLSDMYMDIKTSNVGLNMLFSDGNADLVKNGLYQETIQKDTNDSLIALKDLTDKLEQEQNDLAMSKNQVLSNKDQVDKEKQGIVSQQGELKNKIKRLQTLYSQSQNSAAGFQKVLNSLSTQESQLLAQQELLMQQLFNSVKSLPNGTFVKKGTIIGYQGLTGLTTGYHLHFAVIKNGSYQNPCGFLSGGVISGCSGSGELAWPHKGTFYMSSGYGWRKIGSTSSFHYGIDLPNVVQNAPIYAAHDGWYVRKFDPCDPHYWLCKGGGANYVVLCQDKSNCNNGIKTLYYHLK